jgi:hypothetical protein
MNTPPWLPRTDLGSMPARSNSSQDVSSSSRCCGSAASASRGDMPNRDGSKATASSRKPPSAVLLVPARLPSGS